MEQPTEYYFMTSSILQLKSFAAALIWSLVPKLNPGYNILGSLQLERAVGKIVKLESFQLQSPFQVLLYTWKIVKLESSFQHKTFQLHYFSNFPFQLHMGRHSLCYIDLNLVYITETLSWSVFPSRCRLKIFIPKRTLLFGY